MISFISKWQVRILKFLVILLVLMLFPLSHNVHSLNSTTQSLKVQNVLVLHSYHQGLDWTDEISAGIQSVLKNDNDSVQIYYEYLDTKKMTSKDYYEKVSDFQRYKLKLYDIHFDAIITSDNDALHFLVDYYDELFPNLPVVFCGVNNFHPAMLRGKSNITGVKEYVDYESTIDIMMKLHPDRNRVLVIVDQTSTGIAIKKELDKVIPKFTDRLEFEYFQDFVLDEIEPKISNLSNDYLIYILAFNKDRNNIFISYSDVIKRIHHTAKVPIYGSWDFYLGRGIIGGMITSGFSQGKEAARLTQRILNGESVDKIPIITRSPNKYMFDYKELIRFSFKANQLPLDSCIINKPPGFFEKHQKLLLVFFYMTLGTLIILSVYLIFQRRRRLALEKANLELDRRIEAQTFELKQKNVLLNKELHERQQTEIILLDKTDKLEKALSEVKILSGLIPICANCKQIRDDKGYWNQIEKYIAERSNVNFSHSICPSCAKTLYPEYYDKLYK